MSAEEEDAVQADLAAMEKELVSLPNEHRHTCLTNAEFTCLPQGLGAPDKVDLPNAPRTEMPVQEAAAEEEGEAFTQVYATHRIKRQTDRFLPDAEPAGEATPTRQRVALPA